MGEYIGSRGHRPSGAAVGGVIHSPTLAHGDNVDTVDSGYCVQLHLW